MGEIDRVRAIAPAIGPRPTDRVQPGSERRQHHPHEQKPDELELHTLVPEEDAEPEEAPQIEPDHGLDIAI